MLLMLLYIIHKAIQIITSFRMLKCIKNSLLINYTYILQVKCYQIEAVQETGVGGFLKGSISLSGNGHFGRLSLNIIITSLFFLLSLSLSISYLSLSRSPFQPRGSVHLSTPAPSSSPAPRVHLCPSSTDSPSRGGAEEHAARPMPTAGIWE